MVTWCPTKNLGPLGSAVLTFIGYKQTDKQTNKPNLYIDLIYDLILIYSAFYGFDKTGQLQLPFLRFGLNDYIWFGWKLKDLKKRRHKSNFNDKAFYNIKKDSIHFIPALPVACVAVGSVTSSIRNRHGYPPYWTSALLTFRPPAISHIRQLFIFVSFEG